MGKKQKKKSKVKYEWGWENTEKKTKYEGYSDEGGMFDKERNKKMANLIEEYCKMVNSYFIIDGIKVKDIKDAQKTVEKAIKNLRKNRGDKVYNEERFYEEFPE